MLKHSCFLNRKDQRELENIKKMNNLAHIELWLHLYLSTCYQFSRKPTEIGELQLIRNENARL